MWSGYRRAAWPELYSARPGIVAIGKAYEAEANWCVRAEFVKYRKYKAYLMEKDGE